METVKKAKSKSKDAASRIAEGYKEYLLTEGKAPASVFLFCKKIGLKEEEFYACFGSFKAIEKTVWVNYFDRVKTNLVADKDYGKFTAREKMLAFYFSLTEVFKNDRSFILVQLEDWKNPVMIPLFLKGFHSSFEEWAAGVIHEGKGSGEIARRPFIDQQYQHVLWIHFLFILRFWVNDDSPGFEKTDVAIEKSVNLAFDLIGKGVLDNTIDFGKFLYQNFKG